MYRQTIGLEICHAPPAPASDAGASNLAEVGLDDALRGERRHTVCCDPLITRNNRPSASARLSHEHAIEGIVMVARQPACQNAIRERDGKRYEAAFLDLVLDSLGHLEFPERLLDGKLPRAGCAYSDDIVRTGNRATSI